jgi:streptomycin 6-kinase
VEVPEGLLASPVLQDAAGQDWLAGLPALLTRTCRRWELVVDPGARPRHGAHALVLPVTGPLGPAVLRLARPDPVAVEALRRWDGVGAVRLLAADDAGTALLLERLDVDRSLTGVPALRAAGLAGEVVRRLAVPAPPGIPAAAFELRRVLDEEVPGVPGEWVDLARACARDLLTVPGTTLVHSDLTRENVVGRPGGGFVAIDPRPLAGIPERSVAEFLLRSVDDRPAGGPAAVLREFVAAGGLDHGLAWRWAVTRNVDYWSWAVGAGLTEDPERCRVVLGHLGESGNRPTS